MTAPATPAEKNTGTEYIVLRKSPQVNTWAEHAKTNARSAEAAIRDTVSANETDSGGAGTYVAIPARSWNPVAANVQTVTTLKLESA